LLVKSIHIYSYYKLQFNWVAMGLGTGHGVRWDVAVGHKRDPEQVVLVMVKKSTNHCPL